MIERWRSIFGKGSAVGTLNCQDLLVAGLQSDSADVSHECLRSGGDGAPRDVSRLNEIHGRSKIGKTIVENFASAVFGLFMY